MTDTDAPTDRKSLLPIVAIGAAVLVIVLAVLFWPSEQAPEVTQVPIPEPEPEISEPAPEPLPEPEPEPLQPQPEPAPTPEPTSVPEPDPVPEPELDISDIAVKTAVLTISEYPELGRLLINEDILRRFVVFTENLAERDLARNFHIVEAPDKPFRTYQQAGKEWIDAASFKRYSPYAEALESMPVEDMLELYETYKPAISDHYAEIGFPDSNFDYTLVDAIDHLLDTPEIPVPVEVYTDSVMYKYRDSRIENLSEAQKQLLRTGPENMRVIKTKLREVRDALVKRIN